MCSSALNPIVYKMKSKLPSMASKAARYLNLFPTANLTSYCSSLYTLNSKHTKLCALPMDRIHTVNQLHDQRGESGLWSAGQVGKAWTMAQRSWLSLLPLLFQTQDLIHADVTIPESCCQPE